MAEYNFNEFNDGGDCDFNDGGESDVNNGGETAELQFGGRMPGSTRAVETFKQMDLIHETFIELQDHLRGQSVCIGDSYWDLFAFTEFIAGLEFVTTA